MLDYEQCLIEHRRCIIPAYLQNEIINNFNNYNEENIWAENKGSYTRNKRT